MSSVPLIPLSIIVPVKYEQEEIDRAVRAELIRWQIEFNVRQEKWKPENIRFDHDPDWKNRFWSITCAREGNHWVWKAAKVVFGMFGGPLL